MERGGEAIVGAAHQQEQQEEGQEEAKEGYAWSLLLSLCVSLTTQLGTPAVNATVWRCLFIQLARFVQPLP